MAYTNNALHPVEYHDPHDVFKLLAPGLVPRLPLHNLHWQSHAGPLRSIGTLHVDLVRGNDPGNASASATPSLRRSNSTIRDDGFQTQQVGGRPTSSETNESGSHASGPATQRRHQIPGLRRTPYLKVLLVRCDDNDSYKNSVRSEVREWIKTHTPSSTSKKSTNEEKHDTYEWLIVHIVIPNSTAATQPRGTNIKSDSQESSKSSATSRWRTGSTPLLEKLRSDFNSSKKGAVDRVVQIRIGINDVPYDLLPRVVPAVPTGYSETEQDAENAWVELMSKIKSLILSSFDQRVTQYEEDIKEKDAQRSLPGWNFCTFFILKEGLARGFENVGLVEDALVGYDELSIGLDTVVGEHGNTGAPERHGGVLESYTDELKRVAEKILAQGAEGDEEAVDLQSKDGKEQFDEIPIAATKKPYREMILANKVSVFDFRCYIFSRQIALLLRLGNASSTREELLAKLREQQGSVLHGVAPLAPAPLMRTEERENLGTLGEICRRALQFIPIISQIMRQDIAAAMADYKGGSELAEVMDNMVTSFAFSVAQQILAETSTKALPIPPTTLPPTDTEQKASIPEPKTMMHPARSSSMHIPPAVRGPPSPGIFPGPGRPMSLEAEDAHFAKAGLEELAARRADLYMLSRSILDGLGKKRGWSNGWAEAPVVGDVDEVGMVEVSLDDDEDESGSSETIEPHTPLVAGIGSALLRTAVDNAEDFYRLYEILTDKALRHFTVANHDYCVQANMADLAVLKFQQKEYRAASSFFIQTTPFFSESGWSMLELSMLIMYTQCLHELKSTQDYVRVALKLLTKFCAAERESLEQRKVLGPKGQEKKNYPDSSAIEGVVKKLFELAPSLQNEAHVMLASLFNEVELSGYPDYDKGRDGCSLSVQFRCLIPEEATFDSAALRLSSIDEGPCKELWLESKDEIILTRGKNTITLHCQSVVPGKYRVDYLSLSAGKIRVVFERDANQPTSSATDIFRRPEVTLFSQPGVLDIHLKATPHIQLDKSNCLDLSLSTGWNKLKNCEIRIKPATGGLRLVTQEAAIVGGSVDFAKPPEAGVFYLESLKTETNLTIRFPYTVEQDLGNVVARLEVFYTTESGESHYLAKAATVLVSLAVGVNVQDVFKHNALFSRFSVSTASASPLRIFETELVGTDLFESSTGAPPASTILVFQRQPATFMYKVKRKEGSKLAKRTDKIMYLKLFYTTLAAEIEELVKKSITAALEDSPLAIFSKVIMVAVGNHVRSELSAHDLERATLLSQISTSFLKDVRWGQYLFGLGATSGSEKDATQATSEFFTAWQATNPVLTIPSTPIADKSSILIPVEIPSVPVIHTADIRLQSPLHGLGDSGATPTVTLNQVLPATLHLKWTRIWDTEGASKQKEEFSYEVTAPGESWLLGGKRKGRFEIPPSSDAVASTPETEASIPLVLIPQREGWLPYPAVDIRETGEEARGCEIDARNLGESVRVVSGREEVTVSLDASGPGGGPLVVEAEGIISQGRIVT